MITIPPFPILAAVAEVARIKRKPRLRRGVYCAMAFGIPLVFNGWFCGRFVAGQPIDQSVCGFGTTPGQAGLDWHNRFGND